MSLKTLQSNVGKRPPWHRSSACSDTEMVTHLSWDLHFLCCNRGGKYCQNLCQCWFTVNMLLLLLVFFPLFIFLSAQAHIVWVWVDLHMCIHVLWVGAGHCWGLGFLPVDLLQASLQHAGDLEVGLDQRYFSCFTSVRPAAYSRSCPQCRIGTDKPTYGETVVPFRCFDPWFENTGLAGLFFSSSLVSARCGHFWCLTGALRRIKYGHCNNAFLV